MFVNVIFAFGNLVSIIFDDKEFKKLLQRGQRERHKTIGFNEESNGSARAI